ncbi:MAG: hypothetical protein QM765_28715 [Myxococcales bacterium]
MSPRESAQPGLVMTGGSLQARRRSTCLRMKASRSSGRSTRSSTGPCEEKATSTVGFSAGVKVRWTVR